MTSLDHIFSVEPMKITSPSTDAEVAVAFRVLEGCCLLHPQSTVIAHKHGAVQVRFSVCYLLETFGQIHSDQVDTVGVIQMLLSGSGNDECIINTRST